MTSAASAQAALDRALEILGDLRPEVATRPETYGEWLRRQDLDTLSPDEQHRLAQERAWDAFNPIAVAALDALVGHTVRLKRAMPTVHAECGTSESATATAVSTRDRKIPGGTRYYIRARFADRLLGLERVTGEAYLLRGEWIELAPATNG